MFYIVIFAVGTTKLSDQVAILLLPLDWDVPGGKAVCGLPHCNDSLHMNIGLCWDDLELEPDEKGEASMGPRQAVVEITVLIPR